MYRQEALDKYLIDVSSNTPTPGGGSVSALVGALGTSLASMSSNFTLGKECFKDVTPQIREILQKCENDYEEFLRLMEEDIEAYDKVGEAYALPKSTEEEKKERFSVIQSALEKATDVPLRVMKRAMGMLEYINELVKIADPNLISDVGVAGLLANTALKGAMLNVEINLNSIKNENFVDTVMRDAENIMERAETFADAITEKVKETLNK